MRRVDALSDDDQDSQCPVAPAEVGASVVDRKRLKRSRCKAHDSDCRQLVEFSDLRQRLRQIVYSKCSCQSDCYSPFRDPGGLDQLANLRKTLESMNKGDADQKAP